MEHCHVVRGCQPGPDAPGREPARARARPRPHPRRGGRGGDLAREDRARASAAWPRVSPCPRAHGGDGRVCGRGGYPRQLADRRHCAAERLSPAVPCARPAALRQEFGEEHGVGREPAAGTGPGEVRPVPERPQVSVPRLRGETPGHRLRNRGRYFDPAAREQSHSLRDQPTGCPGQLLQPTGAPPPAACDSVAQVVTPAQFDEGRPAPCRRSAAPAPTGHPSPQGGDASNARSPERAGPLPAHL